MEPWALPGRLWAPAGRPKRKHDTWGRIRCHFGGPFGSRFYNFRRTFCSRWLAQRGKVTFFWRSVCRFVFGSICGWFLDASNHQKQQFYIGGVAIFTFSPIPDFVAVFAQLLMLLGYLLAPFWHPGAPFGPLGPPKCSPKL